MLVWPNKFELHTCSYMYIIATKLIASYVVYATIIIIMLVAGQNFSYVLQQSQRKIKQFSVPKQSLLCLILVSLLDQGHLHSH